MMFDGAMPYKKYLLPVIIFSQFCCTSLWFAGNSVINDLIRLFDLQISALSHLTSAVQFGFILGTLTFAIFTISDRFSPSKVFFTSALLGALFNAGILWPDQNLYSLLLFRFLTGFFLAGIYPVGMKIATDYYSEGLGKSLGFLVGALVLGTSFPYLLKGFSAVIAWQKVLLVTSFLAIFGGTLIFFFVPDGPHRKIGSGLSLTSAFKVFRNKGLRSAAIGYFGHMWELYAFWAFLPLVLKLYGESHMYFPINISFLTFTIIATGSIGCVLAGVVAQRFGVQKIAFMALLSSGICCLISPFLLSTNNQVIVLAFLLFWGLSVTADSPLFSTLVAQNADPEKKGSALTLVNCLGFAISILSIQFLGYLSKFLINEYLFMILAFGPIAGLFALLKR